MTPVRVKPPSRVVSTEVAEEELEEGPAAGLGFAEVCDEGALGMASRETWAKRAGWLVSAQ